MSFVTQEDVFAAIEPVLHGVFEEFKGDRKVSPLPFPRIAYDESMLKYGTDKPDLRNPLVITDVSEIFRDSGFGIFAQVRRRGRRSCAPSRARHRRAPAQLLRQAERLGARAGCGGPGLYHLRRGRRQGPDRQEPRCRAARRAARGRRASATAMPCSSSATRRPAAEKFAGAVRTQAGRASSA